MKPARFAAAALVLVVTVLWFLGGAILIAATGGSEGHVSQKSDRARTAIVALWLTGLGGGAAGLFVLLTPRKGE